jgi:dipeptidyl aminopeptidase/acylaminoacyl peptidase
VTVPAGAGSVVVSVDGRGSDVDLAVSNGTPITDYEAVDHLDASAEPNPRYVVEAPAETIYVDVINLLTEPSDYTLLVTVEGGAAADATAGGDPPTPGADGAPDRAADGASDGASAASASLVATEVRVPITTSGPAASLQPGRSAVGRLEGVEDAASFHTFVVDVPAGTESVTLRMTADLDLDMAARIGGEIDHYAADGNWHYRDVTTSPNVEFTIRSPETRIWVDVFNLLGAGVTGSYTLEVR